MSPLTYRRLLNSLVARIHASQRLIRRVILPSLLLIATQIAVVSRADAQDTAKLLEAMKALNEAQQLVEQGKPKEIHQGVDKYKEAQALLHNAGQPLGEAAALAGMGMAYSTLEEWGNALRSFNQAITLARSLKEPFFEATALAGLAFTYTSSHQYAKAVTTYEEALKLLEGEGDKYDRTMKSALLTGLGLNCVMIGEQQKGFAYFDQALSLKRNLQDRSGEAQVLTAIGATYGQLGEKQKAFDYLTKALQISRDIADRNQEILSLGTIASIYRDAGESQKALDYFEQVLTYRRSKEDRNGESDSLTKIAGVYSSMGEVAKALEYFNRALQIKRDTATLNNVGELYSAMGEFQKATDFYGEALSLEEAEDDRRAQASTLANIGSFYFDLGERQKALDYYDRALPIMHAMNDQTGEAHILGRIAAVAAEEGNRQKALEDYNRTLQIFRATGDRFGEVNALINLGGIYAPMGERQKALDYYAQALPIARQINDRVAIATVLNNTGEVYRLQDDHRKALDYYNQAIDIVRRTKDRQKEASTLGNIAKEERALGDFAKARVHVEEALDILESLRANITSRDLRASYFAKAQGYFEFYIDLLMNLHKLRPREGFDIIALQASERARARSLMETLIEARANIREGVDPQLLARERSLQQQLNAQGLLYTKLASIPNAEEQAGSASNEIRAITTQYQEVETKIRQVSPRYAALTQPQPLDLKSIQSQLDSITLLLEYSLGTERSYVWLVSPTEVRSFELPGRKDIETATRSFHDVLVEGSDAQSQELVASGTLLSQRLLGPASSLLGQKRLVIVADGALQYLPFAALPDPTTLKQGGPTQPLILQHEIVSLPSISVLATMRSEPAERVAASGDLAVLADPVFDPDDKRVRANSTQQRVEQPSVSPNRISPDQRLTLPARKSLARREGEDLSALPGTRKEAEQIFAFVPAGRSRKALDFEATRQLAISGELSRYRYLHFATHGLVDGVHPELAALVLSLVDENGNPQDGYLRAHEIYNLRLSADLVVLSACKTALGKEVRGEGLISLTRGFMYAGVPRVVASLWRVDDDSPIELMKLFYEGMIREGKPPAAALRAAQLQLLKTPRWQAPHFWAAFVLQGEWR